MREANTQGKGHHRRTLGLGLLLTATALAAGAIRISINGRVVPGTVVNIGGQNYVPVSALSAAGFKVSTAGGTLSITTAAGTDDDLQSAFRDAGIPLTWIGQLLANRERRVARTAGGHRPLPRYDADEITRVFARLQAG